MFKHKFATLSDQKKIVLLAYLAHDLTVCVRGIFLDQSGDELLKSLRAFNELQHQISAHIGRLADGSEKYPDDVFTNILDEIATAGGIKSQFEWSAANAMRTVG
jgi:hypothetical protein